MIHLKGVREEHIKYTAELARYSNEVTTTYKETPRSDQENRSAKNLCFHSQCCGSGHVPHLVVRAASKRTIFVTREG